MKKALPGCLSLRSRNQAVSQSVYLPRATSKVGAAQAAGGKDHGAVPFLALLRAHKRVSLSHGPTHFPARGREVMRGACARFSTSGDRSLDGGVAAEVQSVPWSSTRSGRA